MNKTNKFSKNFLLYLIISFFISSELMFIMNSVIGISYFVIKKRRVVLSFFKGYFILLIIILLGILSTMFNIFMGDLFIESRDLIREIVYYLNPISYIAIGAIFAYEGLKSFQFINTLTLSSLINLISYFTRILVSGSVMELLNVGNNIYDIRNLTGTGDLRNAVVFGLILSNAVKPENKLPRFYYVLFFVLASAQIFLQMSRTPLLIILLFFVVTRLWDTSQLLVRRIVLVSLLFLSLIVMYPRIIQSEIFDNLLNKFLNSFSEVSSHNDYSTLASIQQNWRGYESSSAINQWLLSSPFHQIIGFGWGSKIYVGPVSTLVDPDSNGWISVLHNGYYTMLIKQGILGVMLYLFFYIRTALEGLRIFLNSKSKDAIVFVAITLVLMLQTFFLNGLFMINLNYFAIISLGYYGIKLYGEKY